MKARALRSNGVLGLIGVLIFVGLSACGDQAQAPQSPATAKPESGSISEKFDPMVIKADDAMMARLRVDTPSNREVADTIRIAGRLEVNGNRTARIGAPVTGRITRLDVMLGQQVASGQELAEINSPELADAQLTFLKAHSQQQLLSRAVERAQLLLAADVIGSAELQRRQNEMGVASAEKRAASDQLRVLGLSPKRIAQLEQTGQIAASAPISSTIKGTVIERRVAQGQVVNPSDVLFVVTDLDVLWAVAEVPEQEADVVKRGQKVEIVIPALDELQRPGKVAYVSDVVNPETRTVRVGVELENRDRQLKPAMLMTMLVEGRSFTRAVVPVGAVVRENNADFIFIESAPRTFKLIPVELGMERDGKRPLLKALPPGTKVVLDGAFHLNNERDKRNTSQ